MGNGATIAIEICENADGNYAKAEENAALLTAHILYENHLPSDAIRMHHNWSGKNCPHKLLDPNDKESMRWEAFKNVVKEEYEKLQTVKTE